MLDVTFAGEDWDVGVGDYSKMTRTERVYCSSTSGTSDLQCPIVITTHERFSEHRVIETSGEEDDSNWPYEVVEPAERVEETTFDATAVRDGCVRVRQIQSPH